MPNNLHPIDTLFLLSQQNSIVVCMCVGVLYIECVNDEDGEKVFLDPFLNARTRNHLLVAKRGEEKLQKCKNTPARLYSRLTIL